MGIKSTDRITRFCLVACFVGVAVASGCAKPGVVGKWSGSLPGGPAGLSLQATVEYKADGTETMTGSVMGRTMVAQGNYTINGDTISQTITGITLNGSAIPNIMGGKSQDATFKIDGDSLTLTPKNQVGAPSGYVMKRVTQ